MQGPTVGAETLLMEVLRDNAEVCQKITPEFFEAVAGHLEKEDDPSASPLLKLFIVGCSNSKGDVNKVNQEVTSRVFLSDRLPRLTAVVRGLNRVKVTPPKNRWGGGGGGRWADDEGERRERRAYTAPPHPFGRLSSLPFRRPSGPVHTVVGAPPQTSPPSPLLPPPLATSSSERSSANRSGSARPRRRRGERIHTGGAQRCETQ